MPRNFRHNLLIIIQEEYEEASCTCGDISYTFSFLPALIEILYYKILPALLHVQEAFELSDMGFFSLYPDLKNEKH